MHKRAVIIIIALSIVLVATALAFGIRYVRLQSPIVFLDKPHQVVTDEQGGLFPLSSVIAPITSSDRSREEILAEYENKTMSFDDTCQAYPDRLTVPRKTVVVFNNKTNTERSISIDGRAYTISANNHALVAINLQGKYYISCDGTASGGLITVTP
ncbi:MAG: hypothetical protein ACOYMZ_00495 [Minisyncoccia bacterium]